MSSTRVPEFHSERHFDCKLIGCTVKMISANQCQLFSLANGQFISVNYTWNFHSLNNLRPIYLP